MVQQLHEQQQQQQKQQQLQDSSSTVVQQDMDAEKADAERRERIQRYKDERRKQIAARYGGAEWSSSEESGGDETSYRSYRRRRRAKDAQDTSSTEQSTLETRRGHENGSSLEGRGNRRLRGGSSAEDVVQGVGRSSNRTARLRQSPLSHIAATNLLNDNATADSNRNSPLPTPPDAGSEVSSELRELPPLRRPTDIVAALDSPRGMVDSAESPLSGSDTRSGRRRGHGDKDKSNKRKSNLNRATTSEETADLYVLSQPSDSNEDTPRRRRRRAPVSPSGSTGLSAVIAPEPLKTPDVVRNVVARLTPPASPTPIQSPQLHPSNSFQPIQPADGPGSQSAPSTLETRARQAHGSDTRRHSGVAQDANNVEPDEGYSRKHPPKLAPLRKPEIPDVLRPKDTSSLASPGVVNTPSNSRPSSVVLDKPPLGPEGLRPAALRSSLRKPPDAGTCFMASRREKVNETKPPTDNFLRELQTRPKKGDRLSKSDLNLKFDELSPSGSSGASELEPALSSPSLLSPSKHLPSSEENLSNRLDQISARARDTLERVDRLAGADCPPPVPDSSPPEDSADNMVHECEEYLTVNASNKKDTGSGVVHRETKKGNSSKSIDQSSSLASKKGVISDTGQKNWRGGSEGSSKKSKRLVLEKEVSKELKKDYKVIGRDKFNSNTSASPSGPPDNTTHKDKNNVEPPPDEVIQGLLRQKNADNDTGSQDNSISQSPEHRNKRGSRRCSLDGDSSRNNSPDPTSILKRKSSREDVATERPTTPETHSILKWKTSSRNSSVDTSESDPRPILKKKSSTEELDMFEPRPILKKKSSTDDELDDRPRSILKGGRSREDLERLEGIVSPTPILKRSPRCDSDGEGEPERRSILKRRDTTDGVRLRLNVSDSEDLDGDTPSVRVRSDSAPEASSIRSRGRSPPAPSAVPSHGILKRRSHTSPARMDQMDSELGAILRSRRSLASDEQGSDNETPVARPISPSLRVTSRDRERPLSVAERIAGMEASRNEISPILRRSPSPNPSKSPGVRPKVRPTSFERPPTPTENDRVNSDAYSLIADGSQNSGGSAEVEAVNSHMMETSADGVVLLDHSNSASSTDPQQTPDTPSSVSQRAAFFAQLEREHKPESPTTPTRSSRFGRRERSARCQTQPVTETEVSAAARLADTSDSASHDSDGPSTPQLTPDSPSKSMFRNAREAMMRSAEEVVAGLSGAVSPRKRYGSRRTSLNEPDEEQQPSDSNKGILKREGSREARDSPRSILKHHSTSSETRDSRRASYSEIDNQKDACVDHPRGILKPESPLPPSMGSPEHEAKHVLKGVLKKDSSVEDPREIKSILKPQSHSLDPDHSSDSSSDDVTLTPSVIGNTSHKNDLAESVRQIDGVRREDKPEIIKTDVQTTKVEHQHTKAEQKVLMDAALKQAESIEDTHDLAEALRQIGPNRGVKEKHLEQEDKHKEDNRYIESSTKVSRHTLSVSSSSSSTSSSETEMKHIKNEAIVRRRNAHTRRHDERRSMVELRNLDNGGGGSGTPADASSPSQGEHQRDSSSSSSSESAEGGSSGGIPIPRSKSAMDAQQILAQSPIFRNRLTVPGQDAKAQRASCDAAELKSNSPLNTRLAALQKSGNEGWKQRINKESKDVNSNVTLRAKGGSSSRERPVSLFERMSQLESSSQSWKARVSPSDAAKFTVAHKMAASNSTSSVPTLINSQAYPDIISTTPPSGSPLMERKKRSPQQKVFKSKTGSNLPSMLSRASPTAVRKSFRRSASNPTDVDNTEAVVEGVSVSVFHADDEDFAAFFTSTPDTSVNIESKEDIILEAADLDHITSNTSQLLVNRRSIKVGRRQRTARNPLKALAAREDIKSEYTEVKLGTGERELRRMKVEELSKNSNLAVEALAGLASKENFSAVALKKVEDNPVVREMAPYSPLMLIQVKGRRLAQSLLVKPIVSSVNQGDDFILITQTDVFHYKGEFANVIERAKAAEIAQYIIQTKDMGISTAKSVIEIDEKSPKTRKSKFWKLLDGDESSYGQVCGPPEEDDFVEAALVAANKVYLVQEDSLVPITDAWGQMPKVELLASDKTLVFDFGSELYVWSGKRADHIERRVGLALGRELWEEEYDYTDCDINPITPMLPHSEAILNGSRPEWGICAKVTENVETILFKEKFIDWPDEAQQTRIKEVKQELVNQAPPVSELSACDANELLNDLPTEPDLVLEMSHLGRGTEYYDEEERRQLSMSTQELEMWHISENDTEQINGESINHLHSSDSYVLRWKYHITSTGRTLKGAPSKHNVTGRYRVAYFFWQGSCSSISDKGVAALMTVELDKERGPHVRVTQGQECPAFLNLFKSALVVHKGKRDESPSGPWRMFLVRGEMELEAHLVEIEVDSVHLRSRGSLVLINAQTGILHLWHGAKALRHTRKIASVASEKLLSSKAFVEMGWKKGLSIKLKEQFEGAETRDFWEGFGGSRAKNQHFSLLEDEHSYDWTPRMWHMVASHNNFQATEVVSAFRATTLPNPLPFTQADLYSVTQPALFIVDGGHRVWVWQGWWPDESSPEDVAAMTGSATLRFNHARRAALETALTYCQLKAKAQAKDKAKKTNKKAVDENPPVIEPEVAIAGLEPLEFSNLFIHWTPHEVIRQQQEKEGHWTKGERYSVSALLRQLCRTQYSLEEIIARPLPDGVDPLRLEVYLNQDDFFEALGMTREEFYNLQSWKQVDLKKKASLF